MRRTRATLGLFLVFPVAGAFASGGAIGERPVIEHHLDGTGLAEELSVLFEHGQKLFDARFNKLDGQGRPGSTGTGAPRDPDEPAFIRTSAPDANSCFGCHNLPFSGGAGEVVANVFVLAQAMDPVVMSVSPEFSNERNTLGMFGAGPIEMLAREMSAELITIREEAKAEAASKGHPVARDLVAKGVNFGRITCLPDGKIDPTEIDGVDWDLIVKPFHQKGAVVSLREFSNNAMNHHHGMQSVERFGEGADPDLDGMTNELTVGDITAVTVFQAALGTPVEVQPDDPARRQAAARGRRLFAHVGCTSCHVPLLTLDDRHFTEPNPYNPPGNLHPDETEELFSFDMTTEGPAPRLRRTRTGGAFVAAFTDLKRHDLNDEDYDHFDNELLPQGKLNGFAPADDFTIPAPPRPTGEFLTRKLWDVANSDPYGHRGDLTIMTEAIHFHGGDARESRDAFFALSHGYQGDIIEFLKTLQVVPPQPDDCGPDVNGDGAIDFEDILIILANWS